MNTILERVHEAFRRLPIFPDARPIPPYPSPHPPGSPGKIEDMKWRFSNGYSLYHPEDCTYSEEEKALFKELLRDLENYPIPHDAHIERRSLVERLLAEEGAELTSD